MSQTAKKRAVSSTRRTEGVQVGERAARVIEDVLRATAEELSLKGYGAMRVDDVASRSGVNKTTIYRRWPTKTDLVAAALSQMTFAGDVPDTGTIREDLLLMVRELIAFSKSPFGRGLLRIVQTERADPDVERLSRAQRTRLTKKRMIAVDRAIARGDLPRGTSSSLLCDLIFAPIFTRVVNHGEAVEESYLTDVVDTVLAGARARR